MAPVFRKAFTIAALLNVALLASAQGTQYITGPCKSDAECQSACCGFNTGRCEGPVQAVQVYGGCGFGDNQPNDVPARGHPGYTGPGAQYITGPCAQDADCQSNCCGFETGVCQGAVFAQENDGGCGRGDPEPNDRAAQAIQGGVGPGNGNGGTYVTGECVSDADCASSCCGKTSGTCAGPVYAQENYGGCGFSG